MFSANFEKALAQFGWSHSGEITLSTFKKVNDTYPMVLYPAFRLQDQLQAGTLGKRRWVQLAEDRVKRRELEAYREAHNGHLPSLSPWERVYRCGHDPRWDKYGFELPKDLVPREPRSSQTRSVTPLP